LFICVLTSESVDIDTSLVLVCRRCSDDKVKQDVGTATVLWQNWLSCPTGLLSCC